MSILRRTKDEPVTEPLPRSSPPLQPPTRQIDRETSIRILSGVSKINQRLLELLAIPDSLFVAGEGVTTNLCLSSRTDKDLAALERLLMRGDPPSEESLSAAPDYAISFPVRGSTSFCLLVDRARKLIAFAEIGNIQTRSGFSLTAIEAAIDSTLKRVQELTTRKIQFDFVFDGETI